MNSVDYGAIVEARMGSSRLPGKSFMNLLGEPLIKRVIDRITCSKKLNKIVLATTKHKRDDILEEYCLKEGIECFRGSENNVLERVVMAAKFYSIINIVELHGDNPFLDGSIIDEAIIKYENLKCDYISNTIEKSYPMGLRVQVFSTEALDNIYNTVNDPAVEEHVSNYFYENPDKYKIINMKAPLDINRPDIRLTVDTKEDFEFVKKIYKILIRKNLYPQFSIKKMIQIIEENNIPFVNKDIQTKPLR
jgi:spore coat polysaccharide biosynthesis protein SpsF